MPEPRLPDYRGGSLPNLVPSLLSRANGVPEWMPDAVSGSPQVVLLVLDGLGWEQLQERVALAPTLASMRGGTITSVAPTTTAAALTSISTGSPPAVHGVAGYRVRVTGRKVLNVLRWRTPDGDAQRDVPPREFQVLPAFGGNQVPTVTRSEFLGGGFSEAHLHGTRMTGWRVPSTLVTHVGEFLRAGEPLVYAYYDGIDKVAHEFGFGVHYDNELRATDRLVGELIGQLPADAVLVITSDHGQVDVGEAGDILDPKDWSDVQFVSGEPRFRWLHVRDGATDLVLKRAIDTYGDDCWVHTRHELIEAGWFGAPMSSVTERRLGDVAIVPFAPIGVFDPAELGEMSMRCRHGSLTAAEMLVPLVAHAA